MDKPALQTAGRWISESGSSGGLGGGWGVLGRGVVEVAHWGGRVGVWSDRHVVSVLVHVVRSECMRRVQGTVLEVLER